MSDLERSGERFRTTRWTEVLAMRGGDEAERNRALGVLVERYWPAVYAYLRRQGREKDAAAELTQAFFVEVVLGRGLFERAEKERGKLRTLLLTALKRFGVDQHRRGVARGSAVTISEAAIEREEAMRGDGEGGGEEAFERRWARGVLEEAVRRCEHHFLESGRGGHWGLFEARVLRPAVMQSEPRNLSEAAGEFGFETPALAAAGVQTVKRRLNGLLREVVAETVEDAAGVGGELAFVRGLLGG